MKTWQTNISILHLFYAVYLENQRPVLKLLPSYPFLTAVFPWYLQYPSGFFLLLHMAATKLPLQLLADTSVSDMLLTWCIISVVGLLQFSKHLCTLEAEQEWYATPPGISPTCSFCLNDHSWVTCLTTLCSFHALAITPQTIWAQTTSTAFLL